MNAHQRKKNAKAFIAELKACCDDEKVSSLLEAADDLRKLDKENEQLRQRVAELENERDYFENQFELAKVAHVDGCEKLTAERDQMNIYCAQAERLAGEAAEGRCDALKQQRDELLAAIEKYIAAGFGNSTDFVKQGEAYDAAVEAIASVKDKA